MRLSTQPSSALNVACEDGSSKETRVDTGNVQGLPGYIMSTDSSLAHGWNFGTVAMVESRSRSLWISVADAQSCWMAAELASVLWGQISVTM